MNDALAESYSLASSFSRQGISCWISLPPLQSCHFREQSKNGSQSAAAHAELNGLRHRRGHTTHAGLAMMAVTARLGPARNLKSKCAPYLIPDTDGFLHLGQEDFPVA